MELGLGTVQFGLDYGISNTAGKVPPDEARTILAFAHERGIRIVDTAASYGDSERVLGAISGGMEELRIVTKLPPVNAARIGGGDIGRLRAVFGESLVRLKRKRVAGLLLHRPADFLLPGGEAIYGLLTTLKDEGLTERIGISVYDAGELDRFFGLFDFDIVQAPANVLDQRIPASGLLTELRGKGVEVHIRSAFLQGFLLMRPENVSPWFDPIRHVLVRWREHLRDTGLTPVEGALAYIRACVDCDAVIVGSTSARELGEIADAFRADIPGDIDFSAFAVNDPDMVNPARWKRS
jgi:aryl-alcohol dehydrogenase-like predicted oxidoreductase